MLGNSSGPLRANQFLLQLFLLTCRTSNNMSKRKRAQVDEDSSFDEAEIDLTGGENDLADIDVVSDVEDVVQPPTKKRKKNNPTLA